MTDETRSNVRDARAPAPRILVLDDEPMILLELQMALEDEGAQPLDARTVDEAMALIDESAPEAAILDVNLGGGQTCAPIAKRLHELGVPFLLHTGDLARQGELVITLGAEIVPKPTAGHVVAARAIDLVK